MVCLTSCGKKVKSLTTQNTTYTSHTAQPFEPLLNYKFFSNNGGRENVLFEFKDVSYRSINEYKALNKFCSQEIADSKKVNSYFSVDVAEHDFNDDGKTDYILRIVSAVLYGNSGSMFKLILRANDDSLNEIDIGVNPANLAIMKSKTNGLHDIGFSNCYFHLLNKYDGKNSYCAESPSPLVMTSILAGPNNWEVKNGKLFLYLTNIYVNGVIPAKEYLPFYIGIKVDSLSNCLKSSILWTYDKNGNILSFSSLSEPTSIDTFVFAVDIASDNKIIETIKSNFKDGYVLPDDVVFAYSSVKH